MAQLNDALLKELMKSFYAEAEDHLQTLNQSLLGLERDPQPNQRQSLIQDAFRAAHSLKGAARAVSMKTVEELAHSMETVLHQARDKDFQLTADVCDIFYDGLDMLNAIIGGDTVDTDPIIAKFNAMTETSDTVTEKENGVPAPQPVPTPEQPTVAVSSNGTERVMADETIRVNVNKLDDLMAQVSELLVARISAEHRLTNATDVRYQLGSLTKGMREIQTLTHRLPTDLAPQFNETLDRQSEIIQKLAQAFNVLDRGIYQDALRLGVTSDGLQDQIRRMRMVPFQTISLMMERAVRDAARSDDKEVVFSVDGTQVELDRRVLEMLKDPLLHLLRNAVVHGVESAKERAARNKPVAGTIHLNVRQRGSEVKISVSDDGRGFDLDGLQLAARQYVHSSEMDTANPDVVNLAFLPGVSTSAKVTELSGRGVGLDVVRRQLEMVQGRIEVDNRPGEGVTVTLTVPTSLAMTRVLVVQSGRHHYALPLLAVEKIIPLAEGTIIGGKPMLKVDGETLPLVSLHSILELSEETPVERSLVIVLSVAAQRIGLIVDDVITEQELAVKPLQKPLTRIKNISGAALMGNGAPIVVLNPVDMMRAARHISTVIPQIHVKQEAEAGPQVHVLVVDDSITTRTLEKNILEAAGFDVVTATDGEQAMKRLKQAAVDIIVSDIQMPNMDGFTLVRTVRETEEFKHLPIILVTSLESREDRENGMNAGADAYIVKRGFDQAELLATIQQLI